MVDSKESGQVAFLQLVEKETIYEISIDYLYMTSLLFAVTEPKKES